MNPEDELKLLAANLRAPNGEKGIEIANMMHANNIAMTHHSILHLSLKQNDKILEIGHGNCGHLNYLMMQCANTNYWGIDIAELMQKEAQTINSKWIENKQAEFICYDGNNIPFEDNFFTKIFTVNTLYFWQNPPNFLNEIYRVLQPNGKCCITFADKNFMEKLPFTKYFFELYDVAILQQLIQQSEFKIVKIAETNDRVTSKMGDVVTRKFYTAVLEK